MRRHVLSNLDDLGPEARKVAEAAARRAGLSLEDWAAALLAKEAGRPEQPALRMGGPVKASARPQTNEEREARMAAAAAESERLAYERTSRTAVALESMAGWIEHAEERRNGAAQPPVGHQERMASALSQALSAMTGGLDTVGDRVTAEQLPVVKGVRAEIERLQSSMGSLATREEIAALERAIREVAKGIAKDLEQGNTSKDLLTLASAVAALYRQIQTLSEDVSDGLHRRIGTELDLIKNQVDRIAETGVDRSVIDFLSSQIVDLRHDLTLRAEPQLIERLSGEIAALGNQVAELRSGQVGSQPDLVILKTSLQDVCSALNRTVAAQEASDVPEQLQSLSQRLDALARRPEPQPANLDPIADQLALLTERMAGLSESRLEQAEALTEMVGRLSSQVQAMAEKEVPSHEPLMQRFDRIEEELRQVGHQADTSTVEMMLRSIDEKLERAPSQALAFDALEKQIMSLSERLVDKRSEPLQNVLEEATGHLKSLQDEAASIAERAARTALKDLQTSLPEVGDLDVLKQGFVELKALQTRADKKTQQTLRAVHDALETLISRFPEQSVALQASAQALQASTERMPPADRLEAAVRRLHAAALSQIEDIASAPQESPPLEAALPDAPVSKSAPDEPETQLFPPLRVSQEDDLGAVRASFIAAARRAAQVTVADTPASRPSPVSLDEIDLSGDLDGMPSDGNPLSPPSLIERIRRTFESHRRPLLVGLGFLILAAGTAQILSLGQAAQPVTSQPAVETLQSPQDASGRTHAAEANKPAPEPDIATGSIATQEANLFQPSAMGTGAPSPALPSTLAPASAQAGKFMVDPTTVGELPQEIPAPLRQAAKTGDAAAIYQVAALAAEGRGLDKDMILAVRLFERAAQAGLPPAQERLAMLYEKGIGVWRDPKQAAIWYERAAQGGNVRAMHNLASLLASGTNGKPDYATALRWFGEAAEAGFRDSQFNMGVLLTRGTAGKPNLPQAFKWFALAANQGDTEAAKKREEIAMRMGTADLAAVKAAIEQWRPRTTDPIANEIPALSGGQTAALDRTPGSRS